MWPSMGECALMLYHEKSQKQTWNECFRQSLTLFLTVKTEKVTKQMENNQQ